MQEPLQPGRLPGEDLVLYGIRDLKARGRVGGVAARLDRRAPAPPTRPGGAPTAPFARARPLRIAALPARRRGAWTLQRARQHARQLRARQGGDRPAPCVSRPTKSGSAASCVRSAAPPITRG